MCLLSEGGADILKRSGNRPAPPHWRRGGGAARALADADGDRVRAGEHPGGSPIGEPEGVLASFDDAIARRDLAAVDRQRLDAAPAVVDVDLAVGRDLARADRGAQLDGGTAAHRGVAERGLR